MNEQEEHGNVQQVNSPNDEEADIQTRIQKTI